MTIDTLTLRSPDALVASLPFLLGFTPRDSVVVAWLARGALVLTQRLDWPDRDPHGAWLGALLAPRATTRADEVVVVLVGDGGPAGSPAPDVLGAAVQQACEAAGLPLRDLLQSRGDTWRSLLCRDPGCCPAQGRLVDASVRLAVAAEFTAAGHAPLADRADVVASLQPDAGTRARLAPRVAAAQPRPGDREAWRDEAIAAIADAVSGTTAESEDASAVAIAALGDVRVRDTVLWDVTTGTPAMRVRARGILLEALRASPPETVAPVATAFAVVSWLLGDGARAAMAVERALDADGTYSLALLLRHGLEAGLPPQHWAEAMAGLTREECRHGR
jgi:hypothetical protein